MLINVENPGLFILSEVVCECTHYACGCNQVCMMGMYTYVHGCMSTWCTGYACALCMTTA